MEVDNRSLNILKQGIDVAIAAGTFKKSEDVVTLHNALISVQDIFKSYEELLKQQSEAKSMVKEAPAKVKK